MRTITIALGQFLPEDDPKRNAVTMCRVLCDASAHGAELVLFPECCLTGYSVEHAASLAVDRTSDPVRAVEEACRAGAVTACFGYIERTDDGLTITQELFDGGNATIYRKTHLGAREAAVFRAGNVFPVAESPLKTGMQLCWESHIPEISALERSRGAQLLLMPYASAMSGEQCRRHWMVHLPARASDNGAFVAACNLPFPVKTASQGAAAWRCSTRRGNVSPHTTALRNICCCVHSPDRFPGNCLRVICITSPTLTEKERNCFDWRRTT
jgi:predicted amidohydrolase